MPPSETTVTASPVEQLWGRFADMYGGETLKRRYGPTPPEAWREVVNSLPQRELVRAVRRLTHGGNPHLPTLPEFVKLAKGVGEDFESAKPMDALPNPNSAGTWDPWALKGNEHLMGYVTRNYRRFGGISPAEGEFITRTLVVAKNRWVETMLLADEEDRQDGGKAVWDSLMRQAEADIESRRAAQHSGVAA